MAISPRKTLQGKRIVLTRSAFGSSDWEKYLKRRGAAVYNFPTIETSLAPLTTKLRYALTHLLEEFSWVIFTSSAGPYCMRELVKKLDLKMPTEKQMPSIAVIGEKTAEAVRGIGYRAAFAPSKSDSRTLARELKPFKSSILLLRADIASPDLPRMLRARGASVVDLPIYKTRIQRHPDPRFSKLLMDNKVDYLTFASPSAAGGFLARVRGDALKSARNIPAIAFGTRIGDVLRRAGFQDVRVASETTIKGIADAILNR